MTSSMSGSSRPSIHAATDHLTVLDQERGARRDVLHPAELDRHPERTRHLAVPVGEQRHVDAERPRPRRMRPRRSRARSRAAGRRREPDPRSCHAGAEPRSFRWATSPRGRSRGARTPRREPAGAAAPPPAAPSRPAHRERCRQGRARAQPSQRVQHHPSTRGNESTGGDDGVVYRHRLDGERVREARVPVGSYNVTFGWGQVVTPSLTDGTVSLLDRNGIVRLVQRVAQAAHDACVLPA